MQMLFSFASIARVHPWQEEHRKGRQGFFLANKWHTTTSWKIFAFFSSRSPICLFSSSFTAKNKISRLFLSLSLSPFRHSLIIPSSLILYKKYIFHSLPMSPKCPCVCVVSTCRPTKENKTTKKKKREKSLWRQQRRRAINRQKVKRFSRGMSPPPSGYKWDSAKLRGSLFLLPFCLFFCFFF